MLEIVPGGCSPTAYQILQNGSPITSIRQSWWGTFSTFRLDGATFRISHELVSGDLVLRDEEGEILRAHQLSFWKPSLRITSTRLPVFANQTILESHRLWRGQEALGSLRLQNWFRRSESRIELPDLPLPASVFLIWTALFYRQFFVLIPIVATGVALITSMTPGPLSEMRASLPFLLGQILTLAIVVAIGFALGLVAILITRISLVGRRKPLPMAPLQQARQRNPEQED